MKCRSCNSDVKMLHEGEYRVDADGQWEARKWLCEDCLTAEHIGRLAIRGEFEKVMDILKYCRLGNCLCGYCVRIPNSKAVICTMRQLTEYKESDKSIRCYPSAPAMWKLLDKPV